jgi:hypothetical protein
VRKIRDAADVNVREHTILTNMLAEAEALCGTSDALLAGQYQHLRGRIAALVELTAPIDRSESGA